MARRVSAPPSAASAVPPPMPTGRTRAPRLSAAARRQHLLDIASSLVSEHGSERLNMDALARAAHVTRPVVYEHFAGREALIVALIDAHAEFLRTRVEAALRDAGTDLESRLRRTVHAYFDCVAERGRGLRALLAASGSSPAIDAARARARRWGAEQWTRTVRSHTGISAAEAAAVSGAIVASVWLLSEHWLSGSISRRRAEDMHVRMTVAQLDALRRRGDR